MPLFSGVEFLATMVVVGILTAPKLMPDRKSITTSEMQLLAKDDAKPVIPAKAKTERMNGVIRIRDMNVADENRINMIAKL